MRKALISMTAVLVAAGVVTALASAASEPVNAKNYSFGPKTVTISKGDKVVWRNKGGSHTVTFNNGSFDKAISGDDRVSKKFARSGTYRYYCRPHKSQGMKGKVVVE